MLHLLIIHQLNNISWMGITLVESCFLTEIIVDQRAANGKNVPLGLEIVIRKIDR